MVKGIGQRVILVASQLMLLHLNAFAAQAPIEAAPQRACTSQQAQDLLHALESQGELDSVLELLDDRKVSYSVFEGRVFDSGARILPKFDLQRLRQEGNRYHLHIALETGGILGFVRTADVISVEFEGSNVIARSCGKVLTGL